MRKIILKTKHLMARPWRRLRAPNASTAVVLGHPLGSSSELPTELLSEVAELLGK